MLIQRMINLIVLTFLMSAMRKNDALIIRDGSLKDLAKLLNNNTHLFRDWNNDEDSYESFIESLVPYIISPPAASDQQSLPLSLPSLPEPNCTRESYSQVLTGKRMERPRIILDFVPFGYDVDLLEIRFYEYFDLVDAFVIFETPLTLSGVKKPILFPLLAEDPRFKSFMHKVIYVPDAVTVKEASRMEAEVKSCAAGRCNVMGGSGLFTLYNHIKKEVFVSFNRSSSRLKHDLLARIESNPIDAANALGTENDGDEIITGLAMLHLKNCEIKPEVLKQGEIYMPCTMFKKNFHIMETMCDARCFSGHDFNASSHPFRQFLWVRGPTVLTLSRIFDSKIHDRSKSQVWRPPHCYRNYHMGLGAAFHMSATAEPSHYWLKRGGVVEQSFKDAITLVLIEAGQKGAITPEMIFENSVIPWCAFPRNPNKTQCHDHLSVHTSTLTPELQLIVNTSMPRVVRAHPSRYPFLVPGLLGGEAGLMEAAGRRDWTHQVCSANSSLFCLRKPCL